MDKVYCGLCNRELIPADVKLNDSGTVVMNYHPCPIHWDQVATTRLPGTVLVLDQSPDGNLNQ